MSERGSESDCFCPAVSSKLASVALCITGNPHPENDYANNISNLFPVPGSSASDRNETERQSCSRSPAINVSRYRNLLDEDSDHRVGSSERHDCPASTKHVSTLITTFINGEYDGAVGFMHAADDSRNPSLTAKPTSACQSC